MQTAPTRLKEARARKLLTQKALAAKAGIDASTIVRAEKGEPIGILSQERIARALDVPRDYLFQAEAAAS
jgi:transcriptional regulator with XRE-family HTH domain